MGKMIQLTASDGHKLSGYLAEPAGKPASHSATRARASLGSMRCGAAMIRSASAAPLPIGGAPRLPDLALASKKRSHSTGASG